ncbi:MAG: PfkB family carbohydrate kinase [Pseudomonadota bacterium]
MASKSDMLCIGSVLWDVIGRRDDPMSYGDDRPGRIERIPGGVALNVAMALSRAGLTPSLLSCVGKDVDGDDLIAACNHLGIETDHIYRSETLRTDIYMAIEANGELVAAMADAHSLEAAGFAILAPLADGRLGSPLAPYAGTIVLDGNLTVEVLDHVSTDPLFAKADLRVAPASPGKARRLRSCFGHDQATFYLNVEEACLICDTDFPSAREAAIAMREAGAKRVVVTHGSRSVALASRDGVIEVNPPEVTVTRVTGAGDTFMAGHIAAEKAGKDRYGALATALDVTATYIAGGENT